MASIEPLFTKQTIFKSIDNFIFSIANVEENERKESESYKKSVKKCTPTLKKNKRRKRCRKLIILIILFYDFIYSKLFFDLVVEYTLTHFQKLQLMK